MSPLKEPQISLITQIVSREKLRVIRAIRGFFQQSHRLTRMNTDFAAALNPIRVHPRPKKQHRD